MRKDQVKAEIEALLREREGYERYGNTEAVKEVDAQLEHYGHKAKKPSDRATKMTPKDKTEL